MKIKAVLAAVAVGLLATAGSCQVVEEREDCEWELESVAFERPKPPAPPKINKVNPVKPAEKMPQVKPGDKPVKMPTAKPKKPSKAPKGKVWEYDCD